MEPVHSYSADRGAAESNRPKFSIIMPCYNSEAYVLSAIESIVNQTYPNWELIAVNDGSTDSTRSILEEHAAKDERIRVYSKPNGGYISAVNYGLDKISGDYFLLLGSDDRLDEHLFSELSRHTVQELPDCIAFRTIVMKGGISQGIDSSTDFSDTAAMFQTSFSEFVNAYPNHAAIFSGRDTSKCFKRDLLGDLRYFGKYGFDADGIFSMLLCHNAASFLAVPVDGYYWTLRGDSLSGRKSFFAQDCDRVENWIKFYKHLLKMPAAEITSTEKEYLYYFLEIIGNTWKASKPSLSHYTLINSACKSIQDTMKKTGYSLSLSGERKLLLYLPVLWKLYTACPGVFREGIQKVWKLVGKTGKS